MLAPRENDIYAALRQGMAESWRRKARPKQLAPPGDWSTWVIRAGRGFGKTRSGTGWVHERAMDYPGRWIALVARTPADARDYMVEGPGGILRNTPQHERPLFESSKRRLTWPNGSWATIYSDEEPDQLRGYSGDTAWLDEFAKYRNARDTWQNLQFGMREKSTDRPRRLITTTPRPIAILREIEKADSTVVVTGSSHENEANLDPLWLAETLAPYEGTRLGRQEIEAELLEDTPGALWQRDIIDRNRVAAAPDLIRIVVAVDPSVSTSEKADECGIVVAGIDRNKHVYVLADLTARLGPMEWARRAVSAYHQFDADRIVAEVNNGGDLVAATVRTVEPSVPFKSVRASRGKVTRAEPVSSLYEQGKAHHVGSFPELEDQMCAFTADFNRASAGYSPDRVDALVWAATELGVGRQAPVAAIGYYTTGCATPAPLPEPEWFQKGWKYQPNDILWKVEVLSGRVSREEAVSRGFLTEDRAKELGL